MSLSETMEISDYRIDFEGKVNDIQLLFTNSLLPLFETIVNSIQSLEDSENVDNGKIEIIVERDHSQLTLSGFDEHAPFKNFTVIDNGEGFNIANYNSFLTDYSRKKIIKGCKGIGRFLWLKAFDYVTIDSVYRENDVWKNRSFTFSIKDRIKPKANVETLEAGAFKTSVRLNVFHKKYIDKTLLSLEELAEKIIKHCLPYFLSENCPIIILQDVGNKEICLNNFFNTEIKNSLSNDEFELEGEKFSLYHFKQAKGKHELYLCANSREVRSEDLKEKIPNLGKKIVPDDRQSYFYTGYLMSPFLDRNVNSNRTKFEFEGNEGLLENEIMDNILKQAKGYISNYLRDDLSKIEQNKKNQIDEFVKREKPQYRFLLNQRPEVYEAISPGLTNDKLEYELHRQEQLWELEIHTQGRKIVERIKNKEVDKHFLTNAFNDHMNSLSEINKSSLAEYIIRRKNIIELLEATIEISDEGMYSREDAVHSIICPMKYTSDEIPFEEMNLWLIDDRLAYHDFLSSDKSFKSLPMIESDSLKRMDLAIFDTPLSFSEDKDIHNSISVIELKRAMRNDLDQAGNNPIAQVLDYVEALQSGQEKNHVGRPIRGTETTAFYCYIIADLTVSMIKVAKPYSLTKTADNQGYFGYFKDYNAYVQIMTYDKLVSDAKKRNQILFDKLFNPKIKMGKN